MSSKENATTEETSQLLETAQTSVTVLEAAKEIAEVEEKAKEELNKVQSDVKDVTEHAEKEVDKAMEELKGEAQEAHEDTMDEVASLKEDVKEHVEKHSRILAIALYLCGCVSMLWKRKEDSKKDDKIKIDDVEKKIENKK